MAQVGVLAGLRVQLINGLQRTKTAADLNANTPTAYARFIRGGSAAPVPN
jgi:hypothetical protein